MSSASLLNSKAVRSTRQFTPTVKKFFLTLSEYINSHKGSIGQLSLCLLLYIISMSKESLLGYLSSFGVVKKKGIVLLNISAVDNVRNISKLISHIKEVTRFKHLLQSRSRTSVLTKRYEYRQKRGDIYR